jgi:serine/threonine-protein kinase RsbT
VVTGSSPQHVTRIQNVTDVSSARRAGMDIALEMGFPHADATKIAVTISELARNILAYAQTGLITIISRPDAVPPYIKIIASDHGPGIPDLKLALSNGWSSSGGLGLGLPGTERLMDDFAIESKPGQGTIITAVKWLR